MPAGKSQLPANICRSPMAEYVLKDMAEKAGLAGEFHIESAATNLGECGSPVYSPAQKKLAEHGISCNSHAARQLKNPDYDNFDYLICMDGANLRNTCHICGGDYADKISLLLDHTDHPRDIVDPWYNEDFDAAWRDIEEGCRGLLKQLQCELPARKEG